MGQEDYKELSSFLRRFLLRANLIKVAEGLCLILAAALLIVSLGLGVEEIKTALPYAPLGYSLLALSAVALLVGRTLFQCIRGGSEEWAARYIEERRPDLRNNLISSLQLYPQVADEKRSRGISTSMVLALLRATRTQIKGIRIDDLINTQRLRNELRLLALLLVPVVALVLLSPSSVGKSFSLLIHPLRDLPLSETFIDVTPKGLHVARGSEVTVRATASGAMPESMHLILSSDGERGEQGTAQEKLTMEREGEGKFSDTIREVREKTHYRVAAGPFSSPWYTIEAVDPPEIGNLKITLYPPHYTRLPTKTFDGGNIEGIKGSTIRLEARTTKELAHAKLLLEEGREVPLKVEGRSLQGSLVLFQSQRYQILAEDPLGFRNSPISYRLEVPLDGVPAVELISPKEDLEVNGDETLALDFSARDDFGIDGVTLVAKVGEREERISVHKGEDRKLISRERFSWDLARLGLGEGDEVVYHLEVRDNDTISGPKIGLSQALRLRLKNLKAEHRQIGEMIRDLSNQMVNLLGDHLENPPLAGEEPRPRAEPAGKSFEQQVDKMMRRIEEVMERTEKDRLSNFATWSDLQSLKRNLQYTKDDLLKRQQEASSPEEKERIHDEISSELERMSMLAEDIGKRLAAQELASTAQDLMKSQERLLDALEKTTGKDKNLEAALKEISKLAELLGKLQQALSQFASRLPQDFVNSEAVQGLRFGEMRSTLDEIRKKLQQGDIEGAMQLAREMFNRLASMVASLRNAQQMAMSSMMGRMQGEMMRSTSVLDEIAREQQEILVGTEEVHKEALARREALLKENMERFQAKATEELTRLSRLFPDQETEGGEPESSEEALDETTLNNLFSNLMARLKKKDLDAFSKIMETAQKELLKKRGPGQEEKAGLAETGLKGLMRDIEALLKEPDLPLSERDKNRLGALTQRQRAVKEDTRELHEKLNSLFQIFPSLDPRIIKNILDAATAMGNAEVQLRDMNARDAIPPEQEALERLTDSRQQLRNSMQQLAQRGQLGRIPLVYLFGRGRFLPSGELFPLPGVPEFPEFDVEGGITGLDTEKFQLPGKDDYKVPRRFREEILESLKQGVPDQFKDQIESYFKDLSQ